VGSGVELLSEESVELLVEPPVFEPQAAKISAQNAADKRAIFFFIYAPLDRYAIYVINTV
jgi:hypothetical protein